jgi:hypothetical protein
LLQFNGANINEKIGLSANGGRLRFTRDVANITLDADDVENVDVHALGGTDTITVDPLAGTDVSRVDVDLASTIGGTAGDGAADAVVVNGTTGPDLVDVAPINGEIRIKGLTTVFVSHFGAPERQGAGKHAGRKRSGDGKGGHDRAAPSRSGRRHRQRHDSWQRRSRHAGRGRRKRHDPRERRG